jgi:hypothetical protein
MAPGIITEDASVATHEPRKVNGLLTSNGHLGDGNETFLDGAAAVVLPTKVVDNNEETNNEPIAEALDETPEYHPMKCEIKHLDRRYDDKDEQYFEERKNETEKPRQKDWWRLFAFCLVRDYDSDGDLEHTRLYVNHQPLRQLLKDVIGNYPSDPIDVDDVQIESPYQSLFHYRKPLELEGLKRFEGDDESLKPLHMLLQWIKTHFELEIAAHDKCVAGGLKAIAYERLWTLFPPGTIVHSKLLNQHRAFRVVDTWYDTSELPGLGMTVNFVDFDGDRLGTRRMELFIPKYTGTRELSELSVMPLDLLEDADEVREELIDRGRRFESYIGQHYLQYSGIALKKATAGYARFNVSGRVMIDCKTYHRLEPNDSFIAKALANDEAARRAQTRRKVAGNAQFVSEVREHDRLSDEDASLTNATVRGYSFTVKRFLEFFTDQLCPIEWNTSCFDGLVLDPAIKKTVRALVSTHSKKRDSLDDIVKGKGQGLVCVLHGPPGVGKTLTAECVAEYVQRPLYMVSSGDCKFSQLCSPPPLRHSGLGMTYKSECIVQNS